MTQNMHDSFPNIALLCYFFRYGQLSGMVEPVAGILGAFAVVYAEPLLPYALAFAAGAMIYVVVDDIIPEAHTALVSQYLLISYPFDLETSSWLQV